MGALRQWLLGVVLTAFAGGLARQLAPRGREQAAVRLVTGLMLMLAILRPLGHIQWEDTLPAWQPISAEDQAEEYRKDQLEDLSAIIAERTETYIWDKADQLGLTCRITVTTAAGESGIPLPDTVTVFGPYSPELAAYLEEGVGIPAEKQIWLEESTWSETKERK